MRKRKTKETRQERQKRLEAQRHRHVRTRQRQKAEHRAQRLPIQYVNAVVFLKRGHLRQQYSHNHSWADPERPPLHQQGTWTEDRTALHQYEETLQHRQNRVCIDSWLTLDQWPTLESYTSTRSQRDYRAYRTLCQPMYYNLPKPLWWLGNKEQLRNDWSMLYFLYGNCRCLCVCNTLTNSVNFLGRFYWSDNSLSLSSLPELYGVLNVWSSIVLQHILNSKKLLIGIFL